MIASCANLEKNLRTEGAATCNFDIASCKFKTSPVTIGGDEKFFDVDGVDRCRPFNKVIAWELHYLYTCVIS